MKKILVLVLTIVLCASLCACGIGVADNSSKVTNEETTNKTEQVKTWQTDALNEDFIVLNRYFRPYTLYYSEDESNRQNDNTLKVLIERLKEIRAKNLMADKFLDELEKTDYFSLKNSDKFFFDVCIKLLMNEEEYIEDNYRVCSTTINEIINLTSVCEYRLKNGKKSPEYDNHLFLKFDKRSTEDYILYDHNFGPHNNYMLAEEKNDIIIFGDAWIYDTDGTESLSRFEGKEYTLVLKRLKTKHYKDIIERNKNFFEFIVAYREDVYKKIRNAELDDINDAIRKWRSDNSNKKLEKPTLDMDKNQVLATEWGEPDRKNISEYRWGTREQWVYEGKGYVYLENGIVVAIQHIE